ncbi:MAG: laccase domain-containing protein [Gemmatimonadetes bacterium]|nr:laccase domain-containing protein [Gemmatimonadota bacterium]
MERVRPARECEGLAGTLPVLRIEGLGPGVEAGLTLADRNFRYRDRLDDPSVSGAYAELEAFARTFGGWRRAEQVHGARILRVDSEGPLPDVAADGMIAALGGGVRGAGLLTVTVADCVPVFLSWPEGYGLLHAGWRGTAAGIMEEGLRLSGADPCSVRMHLGPAIGACCYEVGPEVVR